MSKTEIILHRARAFEDLYNSGRADDPVFLTRATRADDFPMVGGRVSARATLAAVEKPAPSRPAIFLEILTPDELAERLKVTRNWISEKRRPRSPHPLPALTIRPLRFNWYAVVEWLEEEARRDADRLAHKRALPVRHRNGSGNRDAHV